MELSVQMSLLENEKMYKYLKQNSYYFKYFDRGVISLKQFSNDMKIKYKEKVTDKISNVIDNIDVINGVLDVLK